MDRGEQEVGLGSQSLPHFIRSFLPPPPSPHSLPLSTRWSLPPFILARSLTLHSLSPHGSRLA